MEYGEWKGLMKQNSQHELFYVHLLWLEKTQIYEQ